MCMPVLSLLRPPQNRICTRQQIWTNSSKKKGVASSQLQQSRAACTAGQPGEGCVTYSSGLGNLYIG